IASTQTLISYPEAAWARSAKWGGPLHLPRLRRRGATHASTARPHVTPRSTHDGLVCCRPRRARKNGAGRDSHTHTPTRPLGRAQACRSLRAACEKIRTAWSMLHLAGKRAEGSVASTGAGTRVTGREKGH